MEFIRGFMYYCLVCLFIYNNNDDNLSSSNEEMGNTHSVGKA